MLNTKEYGERIRSLREERKLSLDKLASMADISKQALSKIENNKNKSINKDLLAKFAIALNCTKDYLQGDSDSPDLNKNSLREPIIYVPESPAKEELIYLIRKHPIENLDFIETFTTCLRKLPYKEQNMLENIMKLFLKNTKTKVEK